MKQFLISILALGISTASHSQILQSIGLKYGVTNSHINWKNNFNIPGSTSYENRVGLACFVYADLLQNKYLSISPAAGFMQRGSVKWINFADQNNVSVGKQKVVVGFDYITVNTLLKLKIPFGKITPYLSAGPRWDYLVNSSGFIQFADHAQGLSKNIFGATYGFGLTFQANDIAVTAEGCLNSSFKNLSNEIPFMNYPESDRTLIFNLGLAYRIHK